MTYPKDFNMGIPFRQQAAIATYLIKQKLKGSW